MNNGDFQIILHIVLKKILKHHWQKQFKQLVFNNQRTIILALSTDFRVYLRNFSSISFSISEKKKSQWIAFDRKSEAALFWGTLITLIYNYSNMFY